ncbi:peptide MFS transporter [Paraflavisolibacter sp. H34]|uniref:peptide MFS transporter n=1 Tax=Huijunlia imazamoxiresistens TaxID=3127457 RepID=UPI003019ABE2
MKEYNATTAPVEELEQEPPLRGNRHPKQLYLLFFTEMWERFSFYGMKALLLAYMVTQLKFDEPKGYAILGSYAALVYTMPLFGGMLADRFLGYRKAITFGGILMTIGHLVLAIPQGWSFFAGMAFIICGNGFFKPNISSLVGTLYSENDPRKDSAFSIFYMGINLGACLGGLLCGYVGEKINWHYGFGLAGLFMIVGLLVFTAGKKSLGHRGLPPQPQALGRKLFAGLSLELLIYAGSVLVVPVVIGLFHAYEAMDFIMMGLGVLSLVYIVSTAFKLEPVARYKLLAAIVMIVSSILFWAFYEQNSGALNLFAMRNVDMHVGGVELPALSVNNFLPPFWVIALSPVAAWLWIWLNKRGLEPGTPVKFALSFIFLGLGFLVFYLGCKGGSDTGLISLGTFTLGYVAIICGELCISPIGLSMITKLAPARIVGMVMGIWFLASAIGEFLAGKIGSLMSVPEHLVNDPVQSLPYYASILSKIGLGSVALGACLLLLVPVLRKWMGGVR